MLFWMLIISYLILHFLQQESTYLEQILDTWDMYITFKLLKISYIITNYCRSLIEDILP